MQTLSVTRVVAHGCPPRQFAVTFLVGDGRQVTVECAGRSELLNYAGKHYRPGSARITAQAIAKFLELEAKRREPLEQINDELLAVGRQPPATVPFVKAQPHDRQLPVADRA